MANCARCGRELPAFSIGEPSNLCSECRQVAAPVKRAAYRPPFTVALVGLNLLIFAAMAVTGASLLGPTNQQLLKWGADFGPLSLDGQPWRILTSNYVHIGLFHIFFNMWCLWDLGRMSERIFGGWTYLLIYTSCGIGGSLASLWLHPMVVGAGASGAIFGLAGALITALYLGKLPYPGQALRGMMRSLLTFAGYNLLFGAAIPGIDNSAHVGGLVMGLALGAILGPQLMEQPEKRTAHERVVFIAAALLLVGLGTFVKRQNGYVVVFGEARDHYRGQLDHAINELQHAVEQKPNSKLALSLLASTYLEKKDYPHAESTLKRVLELAPSDPLAKYNLGIVYGNTGRNEEARQIFTDLTQRNPNDDDAWTLLGSALDGLGREEEAFQACEKAISLNPKNAAAYQQLGLTQMKLKQTEAAVTSLEQAAQLDPTSAEILKNLAQAYTQGGKTKEATEAFRKADALSKTAP
jgi:membrane associated rhomboid family serine protease/Flp pilus assembly protein TadD